MQTAIFKLSFSTAVHFGEGALDSCASTLMSDTLFSALCIEAIKYERLDVLLDAVKCGKLCISNAFPFDEYDLYLPKPIKRINSQTELDPLERKKFKKLQWIPAKKFEAYLQGRFSASDACSLSFGKYSLRAQVTPSRDGADAEPYQVASFTFNSGCGLYVMVGYRDQEMLKLIYTLMGSMGLTGIGGKRSSGLGKFKAELLQGVQIPYWERFNANSENKNGCFMLLNVALPKDDELEDIISDASYLLVKRSGFINAEQDQEELKKKTLFAFSAGSCFKNKFSGDVFDVSNGYSHPVYRYLKPFFMELTV